MHLPPPLSAPLSNPASPHSEGIGRGAIASDRTAWLSVAIAVSAYALIWSMAQWLSQPNLDRYHDMLESFAWSQTFDWGSFKHPPFFAWVTGAWFAFMPRTDFAFNLLSYANVAVGLLGVAMLARLAGLGRFAAPAVILLFWCLPYTTLAAKFNANAQLLSVWPWAAAALFGSLTRTGWQGLAWSTLCGLCCAAAMLSKYYSGVLLLGMFLAALAHPAARSWFASPRPWWTLAVTLAALVPHALWLQASGFAMLHYAFDQGGGQFSAAMTARFALAPFFYWAPGWLACVGVFFVAMKRRGERPSLPGLLARAWRPIGWRDSVFWLAFTPWAASLGFGLAGAVELSTPWAIPIGFAFPLLWLRNLSNASAAEAGKQLAAHGALLGITSPRLTAYVLGTVWLTSVALAIGYALTGQRDYYRATQPLAQAVVNDWRALHPKQQLGWSGGAWPDNAMLAFYGDPAIRALPGFPDSREASLAPHPSWTREHGVLLCPPLPGGNPCQLRAREWLEARGLPIAPRTIAAARSGWRFPHPIEQRLTVFEVPPHTGRALADNAGATQ